MIGIIYNNVWELEDISPRKEIFNHCRGYISLSTFKADLITAVILQHSSLLKYLERNGGLGTYYVYLHGSPSNIYISPSHKDMSKTDGSNNLVIYHAMAVTNSKIQLFSPEFISVGSISSEMNVAANNAF